MFPRFRVNELPERCVELARAGAGTSGRADELIWVNLTGTLSINLELSTTVLLEKRKKQTSEYCLRYGYRRGKAMMHHILIPTDGSKQSERAIRHGIKLAKALGAKVTGLHVIPRFHAFTYRAQTLLTYHVALAQDSEAGYKETTTDCAKKLLQFIARAAAKANVACDTLHVFDDQPFEAIIATAKKRGCDLISMASHGHSGISGILLGSVAQKVLTHSHIPVLIYR